MIRQATRAFSLPCIEMEGFEADDLIATYARLACEAGGDEWAEEVERLIAQATT